MPPHASASKKPGYLAPWLPGSVLALTALTGLALSGCSELMVASHLWKKANPNQCKTVGDDKIGNPYLIDGVRYEPLSSSVGYAEKGIASWYGSDFHGGPTANGECYNMYAFTAAHRTLPLPTIVRVTNLENNKSVVVKVNDRGPFARGRILDLSYAAAQSLGMVGTGTAPVQVEAIGGSFHGSKKAAPEVHSRDQLAESLPTVVPETAEEEELPPLSQAEQKKAATETAKERALGVPAPKTSMPKPPPFEKRVFTDTAPLKKTQVYVQVGAFGEESRATDQQLALAKLYKTAHISAVDINGKHLLRVRAGPFRSVADADAALEAITQGGFPEAQIKVDE